MNRLLRASSLTYMMVISSLLFAQDPYWKGYTNADAVFDIELEGDHLWLGTSAGLVRYNRNSGSLLHFDKLNSDLPNNVIKTLALEKNGTLWMGLGPFHELCYSCHEPEYESPDCYGLVEFDGQNWFHYHTANSMLPSNCITSIIVDDDDNIWVGTPEGLVKISESGWDVYQKTNSDIPTNYITCMDTDLSGKIYLGTVDMGLIIYDGVSWNNLNSANSGFAGSAISCMAVDSSGIIWLGEGGSGFIDGAGLIRFDGTNWTYYNTSNSHIPDNHVESISIDHLGNLLVGTGGGLARFSGSEWNLLVFEDNYLAYDIIASIATDKTGTLWAGRLAGTMGGALGLGLRMHDGLSWSRMEISSSGLPSNHVYNIAIDREDQKWISSFYTDSQASNLTLFSDDSWTRVNSSWMRIGTGIRSAPVYDGQGKMWLSSDKGFACYNDGVWIFETASLNRDGDFAYPPGDFRIDKDGNKWVTNTKHGVGMFDGNQWTMYNADNSILPTNYSLTLEIDEQGVKWIGHESGLFKLEDSEWTHYQSTNSGLPDDYIECIEIDKDGVLWLGTLRGGVAKFDGINWESYTPEHLGVNEIRVNSIDSDRNKNIWVGTDQGLFKFDQINWTQYHVSNSGLMDNYIVSVVCDSADLVWIGQVHGGISVFNEEGFKTSFAIRKGSNGEPLIFPNPFEDVTHIRINLSEIQDVSVSLYNCSGQLLKSKLLKSMPAGEHILPVEGQDLDEGLFLITIRSKDHLSTRKIIKL